MGSLRKIIREEIENWDWVQSSPLFHGVIIDTEESSISDRQLLQLLHEEGFKWSGGQSIMNKYGNQLINSYRYVLVGPLHIDNHNLDIPEKTIMHDSSLNYTINGGNDVNDFIIKL